MFPKMIWMNRNSTSEETAKTRQPLNQKFAVIALYLIPAALALMIRTITFIYWSESPFINYDKIPGLDMMTHAKFAEDFINGKSGFSCYKLFCGLIVAITGQNYLPFLIAIFQALLGIPPALLAVFTTLHLTRNRAAALLAGIFASLYSTSISYELFILPESLFLLFCSAVLALPCFIAWQKYSYFSLFLAGIISSLPMLTRFSGLLLSLVFLIFISAKIARKTRYGIRYVKQRIACFICGFTFPLLFALLFNLFTGQRLAPVASIPNISYVAQIGFTENLKSLSAPESPATEKKSEKIPNIAVLKNYAEKFLMIFHHYEIPNNINCYFLRFFIPPLKYSFNSAFLLPFAVFGILIALLKNGFLSKYFFLFLFILAVAAPMTFFVPLARYRIALLPAFWIFSVQLFILLDEKLKKSKSFLKRERRLFFVAFLMVAFLLSFLGAGANVANFRSEDFVAYGFASEKMGKKFENFAEDSYRIALDLNSNSSSAAIHLSGLLMKNARFEDAFNVLFPFYMQMPTNKTIAINFASSLLGLGRAAEAEKVLNRLGEPDTPQSKMRFYYQLAESLRLQGRNSEALLAYKKSLDNASSETERQIILKAASQIAK